jgi:hypothetical protein
VTGRSITKTSKRRRATLDVLPDAVRRAVRQVLEGDGSFGVWILLAEIGVDGVAAMGGSIDAGGTFARYHHDDRAWTVALADVAAIDEWQTRRTRFIRYGTGSAGRDLTEWLRGPVTTEVRRLLHPAPWARHISIGVRNLNAVANERIVELCNGNDGLLWELTGRVGAGADDHEPHSSARVQRILDTAGRELLDDDGAM